MASYRARLQPLNRLAHHSLPLEKFCKVKTFFRNIQIFLKKSGRLLLKTMWFRGGKCAVYGLKPWELWLKSMGATMVKLRIFRLWTTNYGQRLGGSWMGLRRTTRQRVNETTSGAVATCSLVVLWTSCLRS